MPGCALPQLAQLPSSLVSLTAFIKVPFSPLLDLSHLSAGCVLLPPFTAYQLANVEMFALSLAIPTCTMIAQTLHIGRGVVVGRMTIHQSGCPACQLTRCMSSYHSSRFGSGADAMAKVVAPPDDKLIH